MVMRFQGPLVYLENNRKNQRHFRNKIRVSNQPDSREYTNKHTAPKKRSVIIDAISVSYLCWVFVNSYLYEIEGKYILLKYISVSILSLLYSGCVWSLKSYTARYSILGPAETDLLKASRRDTRTDHRL